MEWLPQETILFDAARLRRAMRITLAPGARVLAGEMLVFGRAAMGETLTSGFVHDAWEVWRDGRPLWADALHMDGDLPAILGHPACLDGAVAVATAVYVDDDPARFLDLARSLLVAEEGNSRAAATVVNGVLVVRWLGRDAFRLRRAFGRFWSAFRRATAGLAPRMPRVWEV